MRTLFSLICAFVFVSAIGWYVIYKNNPNRICSPHEDKKLVGKYLYCWPGFDMPVDSFVDGYSPIEKNGFINAKKKHILKKEQSEE
jgi:hypothetical protein